MAKTGFDFPKGDGSPIHIVIYVPSTRNIDQRISNAEFKKRITETTTFLRKQLGGSTKLVGVGNYRSDERQASVSENVAKIESFTSKVKYDEVDLKIKKWLKNKKKAWSQEWLSYEFEEALYFI